jgi:6-pyruvoyltetrahydropterin/6-carboxytetrahydropterin synthase
MPVEQIHFSAAVPFEAARHVGVLPEGHRSRRLHGHSFLAKVRALLPTDWPPFPGTEVDSLRDALSKCVSALDYRLLNEWLDEPTDENIARWIRRELAPLNMIAVGIQSTTDEGVDLDARGHAHVWRKYILQSAHQLPNVPPGHKCGRMHGHGFEIILHAGQDLGARALSIDYDRLNTLWAPIHAELDHACLNDVPGLENPTSEMISAWVWGRLKPVLPELSWVTVYETAQCGANFDGRHYRIWKEMTLDSALSLRHPPVGDRRRRIHGHTYTLRVHLNAPLDTIKGWTMDFGDVKELFAPIFRRIDHQPLHELEGLGDPSARSFVRWLRNEVREPLPQVDRIDLFETRGCGAILTTGEDGPALPI